MDNLCDICGASIEIEGRFLCNSCEELYENDEPEISEEDDMDLVELFERGQ